MNLTSVKTAVTSRTARQVLRLKQNSPTLLFVAGVGGVVTATVVACRATLKATEILDKAQADMETFKSLDDPRYSKEDLRKDLALYQFQTAGKLAKLYAPAILIGTASIGCLYGSHRILNTRNAGLMAAYAALDQTYREYRERVSAELGEDREREISKDTTSAKVAKGTIEPKTEKGAAGLSTYARLFSSETSTNFSKEPEYNIWFLKMQQNYLNDMLKARGHVFLNEAYDALGLDRSKAGAVVGWVWDGRGDNFIDFGVWDNRERMSEFYDFATGNQGGIWIDPNVDGVIYDKI